MNTSRGCPFRCNFCSVHSIWGRTYTYFSAERVVSDIEYLVNTYRAKGIYFREDNFTLNNKRVIEICHILLEKNIKVKWACETRVDTLSRNLLQLMYDAGCRAFYIGFESGCQRILDLMKKDITLEQSKNVVKWCKEIGIKVYGSYVVGIPGEAEEEIKKTVEFSRSLGTDTAGLNVFVGIPKSEMYRKAIDDGLYEYIDDRGLVYLKNHDNRVDYFYGGNETAKVPRNPGEDKIKEDFGIEFDGRRILPNHISMPRYYMKDILSVQKHIEKIVEPCSKVLELGCGFGWSAYRLAKMSENIEVLAIDNDEGAIKYAQKWFSTENLSYKVLDARNMNLKEKSFDLVIAVDLLNEISGKDSKRVFKEVARVLKNSGSFICINSLLKHNNQMPNLHLKYSYSVTQLKELLIRHFDYVESISLGNFTSLRIKKIHIPKVSIVMSVFNQENFIDKAVKSILEQTFTDFEFIIINDGSTDETQKVLRRFDDPRIRLIKQEENMGLTSSLNRGMSIAKGKYIARMDGDDISLPTRLEKQVQFLDKHPEIAVVGTYSYWINDYQKVIGMSDFPHNNEKMQVDMLRRNCLCHGSIMSRRKVLEEFGFYDEEFKFAQDYDLWLRVSEQYKIANVPERLYLWRYGQKSISKIRKEEQDKFADIARQKALKRRQDKHLLKEVHKTDSKKILLVVHNFPPDWYAGVEIYTYQFAKSLINNGYDISVFYPKVESGINKPVLSESNFDNIKIYKLLVNGEVNLSLQVDNKEVENVFKKLLDRENFDIIHFQHTHQYLPFSLLNIAKESGIPVCLTLHDFWFICPRTHFYLQETNKICDGPSSVDKCVKCLLAYSKNNLNPAQIASMYYMVAHRLEYVRELFQKVDIVLAPSNYLAQKMKSFGFGKNIIKVSPLGLNPIKSERIERTSGNIKFCYLGTIHELKNAILLAESFRLVSGNARLIFWGNGQHDCIEELKKTIKGDSRISYMGAYKPEDLPKIFSDIDTVILPSLIENYPLVAREALSAGVPVIASNVGGIPEIVSHKKNGILFNPNDKKELSGILQEIVDNPSIISRFKKNLPSIKTMKEDAQEWNKRYSKLLKDNNKTNSEVIHSVVRRDNSSQFKVSIIIPVFNKVEYTKKCIDAIYANTQYRNFEIIIVDNASIDGTEQYLRELEKERANIRIIHNKANLGFAKANNQAAKIAKGEYLLLLNNDTEPQTGWLSELISAHEREINIGVVGAKLLYPDMTIQHAGIEFEYRIDDIGNITLWPFHIYRGVFRYDKNVNQTRDIAAVTAACMLIKKDFFNKLGGLDETYPMYFEDIDLNMKVKKAGKRILYCHTSEIIHYEGLSSNSQAEIKNLNVQSQSIFAERWADFIRNKYFIHKNISVLWTAPFFNPSGYASEAIGFALGLEKYVNLKILHDNNLFSENFVNNMPQTWKKTLYSLCDNNPLRKKVNVTHNFISIVHQPAHSFKKFKVLNYHIGRTMFETDSIPPNWVEKCNEMDELWVPSRFNLDTFSKAGVKKEKIFVIPEGIDTEIFNPEITKPFNLPNKSGFNFLSIFEWTERKGADILLRAYFESFSKNDDVCLYLRTFMLGNYDKDTSEVIQDKIEQLIKIYGYDKENLPRYVILSEQLPFKEMLSLYKSADAFVLPSRGEGWGRPYMEAMAMGLPVIGTNWSGNTAFMTEQNSYLLKIDRLVKIKGMEISFYNGQRWAEPSKDHLKILMREVFNNPQKAKEKGLQARKDIVDKYNIDAVAKVVIKRLAEIKGLLNAGQKPASPTLSPFKTANIIWEGSQFVYHSLALVNREQSLRLINAGYNVSIIPYETDQFKPDKNSPFIKIAKHLRKKLPSVDVHIRHQWPPNLKAPEQGHWVIIQPWEFGSLPKEWVKIFSEKVDEMWVPSNYVRKVYIDSGISSERVFVVPNGVDPEKFNPNVKAYSLKTEKKFKFLFVGGTIFRKGIDILLDVYTQIFSKEDDVCLVIKDMGGKSFYKGRNMKEYIHELQKKDNTPEIEYIDTQLSENALIGLYTACNVLVHPYRGEGFGLPIIEAMACGIPAIVTNGGACLDFCNESNSLLISAKKVTYPDKSIGGKELVDNAWLYEPDKVDLGNKMVFASRNPKKIKEIGATAGKFVKTYWSWDKSSEILQMRIAELVKKPILRKELVFKNRLQKAEQYLNNKDILKAKKIFNDIYHKTRSEDALLGLAICAKQEKDREEALKQIRELLSINPNHAGAYNLSGMISFESGDLENAKKLFAMAIEKDQTFIEAQRNFGEVLLALEDYDVGVQTFMAILKNHPDDVPTLVRVAQLYIEVGQTSKAAPYLEKARQLEPNNSRVLELIEIMSKEGNIEMNSLQIESQEDQQVKKESRLENATYQFTEGNIEQANLLFSEVLLEDPQSEDALFGLALCARQQQDNESALKYLNRLIKINPNCADAYNLSGMISFEAGDFESSKMLFIAAIEKDHKFTEAQRNYGEVLLALEDYENGIKTFTAILEKHPEDVSSLLRMAQLYAEVGKNSEARQYAAKVLEYDSENSLAKEICNGLPLKDTEYH
jgi:glycosyltransferase involved in cell wall biosynthesis/Tfp pilus assembly protein PilF/ubiquinone/menaquinone biosynthesis C-methylase UbiE/pyruvate-formate lyase-activating enzyme/dTDP-glucose pyrophosphorylase